MTLPESDDRLVDGQRIADVIRQDEDHAFDAYFRLAFPGHVPVDQLPPSRIATQSGTHSAPPAAEPDPDADPDTHAGVRRTASHEVLEAKAIDAHVRLHHPGASRRPGSDVAR